MREVELGDLSFEEGGHLLVKRALRAADQVEVRGTSRDLEIHLSVWCRGEGHGFEWQRGRATIRRGGAQASRWAGSQAGRQDRGVVRRRGQDLRAGRGGAVGPGDGHPLEREFRIAR